MLDKYKLNELLNKVPRLQETEIAFTRSMGDKIIIYNYEIINIKLMDDYLIFTANGKERKMLYENIIQVSWRPLFKGKNMGFVVDGKFNVKKMMEDSDNGK